MSLFYFLIKLFSIEENGIYKVRVLTVPIYENGLFTDIPI